MRACHELDHGDLEECSDGLGGALDVAGETAVDAGPGEGALDDPALGLDDEACLGSLYDLDRSRGGFGDPLLGRARRSMNSAEDVDASSASVPRAARCRPTSRLVRKAIR